MKKETAALTTLALLILGLVLMLTSCITTEKAQKILENKGELAKVCAEKYPVKTEYIKGDSIITIDTIYSGNDVIFDTVYSVAKDTVLITKVIPVTKTITKTVTRIDTVVKENTAATEAAKIDLNKCNDKYSALFLKYEKLFGQSDKYRKQRNTAYWVILLLLVALFRKPLWNLVNPIFSKINLFK